MKRGSSTFFNLDYGLEVGERDLDDRERDLDLEGDWETDLDLDLDTDLETDLDLCPLLSPSWLSIGSGLEDLLWTWLPSVLSLLLLVTWLSKFLLPGLDDRLPKLSSRFPTRWLV